MTYDMLRGLAMSQVKDKDKKDILRYASQKKQIFNTCIAKMRKVYKECFKNIAAKV